MLWLLGECRSWKRNVTYRGDWQGKRKAMNLFCLSLKASLASAKLRDDGIFPLSIQDDTYLVGSSYGIVKAWSRLTDALAANGHEIHNAKSEFWAPERVKEEHV